MFIIRNGQPVFPGAYALCTQTVTIYHRDKETGEITRKEISGVYYGRKKTQDGGQRGDTEKNTHLLIIPGANTEVFPGDKVLEGSGPRIATAEEWARFLPSNTAGLVVIREVHPVSYKGRVVHIEAEG